MYNHAPLDYPCPFCRMAQGVFDAYVRSAPEDIVYCDDRVMAFIAAKQWPNNHGHVLVVPTGHYENLYDLPDEPGLAIHRLARRVALAMKSPYGCEGVSTRQHNEPAGYQDVWHYHLHVFPRYTGDQLYETYGEWMPAKERAAYAERLRTAVNTITFPETPA